MTNNNIYFVANWKMYGNYRTLRAIKNIKKLSKSKKFYKAKIIYCPPYTLLEEFANKVKNTNIMIGAQNCHYKIGYGPSTGFISAKMIKDTGSKFVIIGHSESRDEGDTDNKINLKIKAALKSNLKVIFCIGESLKEKKNNKTTLVLRKQIFNGLKNIKDLKNILIAYEPIWSIGTGVVPEINNLKLQVQKIRKILKNIFKNQNYKILYGGSVSPNNINKLSKIDIIDGFLIGGASQNEKKFIDIIKKTIN